MSILDVIAVPDRLEAGRCEWARFFRPAALPGAEVLHARFVSHRYAAHLHDSWTIAAVEDGAASFALASRRYVASAGSAFLIPPGAVHTGEPAAPGGYAYRVLYLEPEQVAADGGPAVIARPPAHHPVHPVVVCDDTLLSRLARLHRLAALMPQARYAEIPDAYVLSMLDDPEAVAREMGTFLTAAPAAKKPSQDQDSR